MIDVSHPMCKLSSTYISVNRFAGALCITAAKCWLKYHLVIRMSTSFVVDLVVEQAASLTWARNKTAQNVTHRLQKATGL